MYDTRSSGNDKEYGLAVFGVFLSVLFAFSSIFVTGYAGYKLWGWFITPAFSIPAPSILTIIGLRLIYGVFSMEIEQDKEKEKLGDDDDVRHSLFILVRNFFVLNLGKLITLAFGWAFYSFL